MTANTHIIPSLAKWAKFSDAYVRGLIDLGVIDPPGRGETYTEQVARRVVSELKTRRHRLVADTWERHLKGVKGLDPYNSTMIRSGS